MEMPPKGRSCEGQGQDWGMDLQIKDAPNHQQTTRNWKGAWHGFSLMAPEGTNPYRHLRLRLQASRAGRKYISII